MGLFRQILGAPDVSAQDRYLDDWVKGLERGLSSATGLRVTVRDALTIPGIAACIQVQSEDIAKVPLDLKRRTAKGFEPATEHPLFAVLKHGPAPWLSSYRWRKAMAHAVLAHGNNYSRVWRTEAGLLQRITPIQTGRTTMRWAEDGEPFFDVAMPAGLVRGLTWQDIVHVAYRDSDDGAENGGVIGISPIIQNKETVALMLAAERFAAKFFGNGARPSIALEYDKKLPNDEVGARIRASVERVYSGTDNAFKVMLLELGVKLKELSSKPADSQLIETRKEGAVQACTMFRTPPHKIGLLERSTNNNIEHQSIDYVTGPISALAKSIEAAIETACLTPEERETYKVEHNLEGLMRGDILSRYRAYAIGRQWGWLSADDVRVKDNSNQLPDGAGQHYLTPLNMVPAGQDPAKEDPAQDPAKTAPEDDDPDNPDDDRKPPPPRRARDGRRVSSLTGPSGELLFL